MGLGNGFFFFFFTFEAEELFSESRGAKCGHDTPAFRRFTMAMGWDGKGAIHVFLFHHVSIHTYAVRPKQNLGKSTSTYDGQLLLRGFPPALSFSTSHEGGGFGELLVGGFSSCRYCKQKDTVVNNEVIADKHESPLIR